jgi:hypothetical protein
MNHICHPSTVDRDYAARAGRDKIIPVFFGEHADGKITGAVGPRHYPDPDLPD